MCIRDRLKAAIDFVPSENEEPAITQEAEPVANEESTEEAPSEVKELSLIHI